MDELEALAPVTAVRGNVDGGRLHFLPLEAHVTANGARIAILHIAGSPLRPNRAARELEQRERPNVLLVGHSHMWLVARLGAAMWFNPGAAGHHGFQTQRTAALLDVAPDGKLQVWRIDLGPRGRTQEGTRSS